jgi:hypothetical protein
MMDIPEILREVDILDKESKNFKQELLRMCWYMRGGISLDEMFALSYEERNIIADLIKENMEATKKSGLPFF